MAHKVPVVKITLSDNEAYSSEAFQSLFAKYVEMRAEEIRTKRENSLWHRFLKLMGFADERIIKAFGMEAENPYVLMDDIYEERQMTLKLLKEFEKWKSQQPKKQNKKLVTYLQEFLELKSDVPLSA